VVQVKVKPYLQNNQRKRAGGMAQAIEHLPGKHKALNSNPSTAKKKKTRGKTLQDIGIYFLNKNQIAIIDKWDCIKLKSFNPLKETIVRVKRQPTEWEKIFARYSSDKGLIFRIHKELKKLNTKEQIILSINGQMNCTILKRRSSNG
jgi:hypothetical protein